MDVAVTTRQLNAQVSEHSGICWNSCFVLVFFLNVDKSVLDCTTFKAVESCLMYSALHVMLDFLMPPAS